MKEFVASVGVRWRDRNLKSGARAAARDVQSVGKAASASSRAAEGAARREGAAAQDAARKTDAFGRSVERAGAGSSRLARGLGAANKAMRATGGVAAGAGKVLDGLGGRLAALTAGIGAVATIRQVGNLQERMVRLGIQAGKSDEEIKRLKNDIYEAANAPDIRVDPTEIMAAVDAIVEKTGDLDYAHRNLRNIAAGIKATGAQGDAIGELLAEFEKMGIIDPKQTLEALDTLTNQGKAGAFTLQNLAALGPRVITAYTSAGRGGVAALREMGAALQLMRRGTGSSEQAATAFEAVMRSLTDPVKIKQLERLGLVLFDPAAAAEGKRVLRPIQEVMAEIIQATSGDKVALGEIFDAEAVRAFNDAAGEFQRTGALGNLDQFMKVAGDGQTLFNDTARAAKTFDSSLQAIITSWRKFADSRLTQPLEKAADILSSLGSEGADKLFTGLAWTGGIVAGLVGIRKAYRGVQAVRGWFGKGKGAGGGLGGAGGDVMDVRVVNWPGGGFGGGGVGAFSRDRALARRGMASGSGGAAAATSRGAGFFSRMLGDGAIGRTLKRGGGLLGRGGKLLGKAFRPLGAVMAVADLASAAMDGDWAGIGGAAGRAGGGALGATLGGLAGSIVPGIGTAIGMTLGGVVGDWVGDWLGSKAGAAMAEASSPSPAMAAAGPVTINVHPTPGMDEEALATKVAAKVERRMSGPSERMYD